MSIIDQALSFIAPHHCYICKKEGSVCCQKCLLDLRIPSDEISCYFCNRKERNHDGICSSCRSKQYLDGVFWFSDYKNKYAAKLIKALKFNNVHEASRAISNGISQTVPEDILLSANFITAIPTANKRVRARGWDQAKLISRYLSKSIKVPSKSLLVRLSSFDQIGATKQERAEASERFFKPIRLSLISGSTIILVDDVLTTGSTLNSAARALKKAGANKVYAATFARQGLAKLK